MRFKTVFRFDSGARKLRLFRLMWERGVVGDGNGYSAKLSVAFRPRVFRFHRTWEGWRVVVAGLELHHQKSWGGTFG